VCALGFECASVVRFWAADFRPQRTFDARPSKEVWGLRPTIGNVMHM